MNDDTDTLKSLLVGGLALLVIAGGIRDFFDNDVLMFVAFLLALIGGSMFWVSLTGYGVRFGMQSLHQVEEREEKRRAATAKTIADRNASR